MCVCTIYRFAFQYNPALQPRAIIVFGCISKKVTDMDIKLLLKIMLKVSVVSVSVFADDFAFERYYAVNLILDIIIYWTIEISANTSMKDIVL